MNKSVINLFESESMFLKAYDNGNDCVIYPNISDATKYITRRIFQIKQDEVYLIFRDTSSWNTSDEGTIVTDLGVTVKPDSNSNKFKYFEWSAIEKVIYQDLCLLFYDGTDQPYKIHLYFFVKFKNSSEGERAKLGKKLARLFTSMAKAVEPEKTEIQILTEQLNKLDEEDKTSEAIELCKQYIYKDWGEDQWLIYFWISDYYETLNDFESQFQYAKEGMRYCETGSTAYVKLSYLAYCAAINLGNLREARRYCFDDVKYAKNEKYYDISIKSDASEDFKEYDTSYCSSLLTYPYSERKIIVPVKEYTELSQSLISVIKIDAIPNEIVFPLGHPVCNNIYIGHPFVPTKYMPIENYQLELVEDKVREFCEIAQDLGATEITIECLDSNDSEQVSNASIKAEGGVAASRKVKASLHNESNNRLFDSLSHSINLHQKFNPSVAPSLPEKLVWYQNEPSWQRLYKQRMSGGLLFHEERIETSKSQIVNSREMKDIKGEIEGLYANMNLSFDKSDEMSFQQQENATLAIKIHFAPLEQLTGNYQAQTTGNKTAKYSSNEQNYINELKECLADGEIGAGERRLLGKLAAKLGISAERAEELEASLSSPILSDDEKEYLEEYKAAAVDGVVSEKERRLLDKLKKMYGISDERAKEIEGLK